VEETKTRHSHGVNSHFRRVVSIASLVLVAGLLLSLVFAAPVQPGDALASEVVPPYDLSSLTHSQVPTRQLFMPMVGHNAFSGMSSQWRFGFAVHSGRGQIDSYDVNTLHAGWYYDVTWRVHPSRPGGIEYMQVVRVGASYYQLDWNTLGQAVANNPGAWWFVGNEPDRAEFQDGVVPGVYAQHYREIYQFIKSRDPSARLAPAGIVQPTPLRLRYLDMILAEYRSRYGSQLPADGWNIHNMILREEAKNWGADIPPGINETRGVLYEVNDNDNITYFRNQIVAFRQWMKANGYQTLPLMISEYGVLMPEMYGFDQRRVINFMYASFLYMLDAKDCSLGQPNDECRLVQRWSWYSLNDQMWVPPPACTGNECGFNGNLFDPATRLITAFGIAYRDRPYH